MLQYFQIERGYFMNFDCVIFDFNGTLFLDDDKHIAAWNEISREIRGTGITEEELQNQLNGTPNQKNIEFLSGGTYTQQQIDFYSQKKKDSIVNFVKKTQRTFI